MTNIEKITNYMNQGPLHQTFVLTAMDLYADKISENSEQVIENFARTVIDGASWVTCANDWEK